MPTYPAGDVQASYLLDTTQAEAGASKMEQLFVSMAGKLGPVGELLTAGNLSMVAFGVAAVEAGEEFAQAFQQLDFDIGATNDQIGDLQSNMKDLYADSPDGLGEIEKSLVAIEQRTNLTGAAAEALADKMLKVSHAFGGDAGQLTRSMTAIMNMWGVGTDAIDKFTAAHQVSGITMSQLESTMEHMGPRLKVLGFSFDETTAMLANFDKAGLQSRRIIMAMTRAMPKVGGNKDALLNDIKDIQDLLASGSVVDKAKATAFAQHLFGFQSADIMAAAQAGAFNIQAMLGQISAKAPGASDALVDKTLGAQFTELEHKAAEALLPIGQMFIQIAKDAMPIANAIIAFVKPIIDNKTLMALLQWGMIFKGVQMAVGPIASGLASMMANMRTMGEMKPFAAIQDAGSTIVGAATNAVATGANGKNFVLSNDEMNSARMQVTLALQDADAQSKVAVAKTEAAEAATRDAAAMREEYEASGLVNTNASEFIFLEEKKAQALTADAEAATLNAKAMTDDAVALASNAEAMGIHASAATRDALALTGNAAALKGDAAALEGDAAATVMDTGVKGAWTVATGAMTVAVDGLTASLLACWPLAVMAGAVIAFEAITGAMDDAEHKASGLTTALGNQKELQGDIDKTSELADHLGALKSELIGATDEAARNETGVVRLAHAQSDLNQTFTDANKLLGDQAVKYDGTTGSIDREIAAITALANAQKNKLDVANLGVDASKAREHANDIMPGFWSWTQYRGQEANYTRMARESGTAEQTYGEVVHEAHKRGTPAIDLDQWQEIRAAILAADAAEQKYNDAKNDPGAAQRSKEAQEAAKLAVDNADATTAAQYKANESAAKYREEIETASKAAGYLDAELERGRNADEKWAAQKKIDNEALANQKLQSESDENDRHNKAIADINTKYGATSQSDDAKNARLVENDTHALNVTHLEEESKRSAAALKNDQDKYDQNLARQNKINEAADKLNDTRQKGDDQVAGDAADLVRLQEQYAEATSDVERTRIDGEEKLKILAERNDLEKANFAMMLDDLENNMAISAEDRRHNVAMANRAQENALFLQGQQVAQQTAINTYAEQQATWRQQEADAQIKSEHDQQQAGDAALDTQRKLDASRAKAAYTHDPTERIAGKKEYADLQEEQKIARELAALSAEQLSIDLDHDEERKRSLQKLLDAQKEAISEQKRADLDRIQATFDAETLAQKTKDEWVKTHDEEKKASLDQFTRDTNDVAEIWKEQGQLSKALTGSDRLSRAAEYYGNVAKLQIKKHELDLQFAKELFEAQKMADGQREARLAAIQIEQQDAYSAMYHDFQQENQKMGLQHMLDDIDKAKSEAASLFESNPLLHMQGFEQGAAFYKAFSTLPSQAMTMPYASLPSSGAQSQQAMTMPYASLPSSGAQSQQKIAASLAISLSINGFGGLGAFVKSVTDATLENLRFGAGIATTPIPTPGGLVW